jgi:hypothetical protein
MHREQTYVGALSVDNIQALRAASLWHDLPPAPLEAGFRFHLMPPVGALD